MATEDWLTDDEGKFSMAAFASTEAFFCWCGISIWAAKHISKWISTFPHAWIPCVHDDGSVSSLYILADNSVFVSAMLSSSALLSFSRSMKTSRMQCSSIYLIKALRYFLIGGPVSQAPNLSRRSPRTYTLTIIASKYSFLLDVLNAELLCSIWTAVESRPSCLIRSYVKGPLWIYKAISLTSELNTQAQYIHCIAAIYWLVITDKWLGRMRGISTLRRRCTVCLGCGICGFKVADQSLNAAAALPPQ